MTTTKKPAKRPAKERNERTSRRVAAIAARGLRAPSTLSCAEIKAVCASVLTQAPDR